MTMIQARLRSKWWLFMFVLIMIQPSHASIAIDEHIDVGGFGSFAASQSNQSVPVLFSRDITDDICYDCDTTLGLQLDAHLDEQWRMSLQTLKKPDQPFSDMSIEWAFVEYRWRDWGVKIGRQRIPLFIMSESLFVSQAYPWFRPPPDVYDSVLGISHSDGVSLEMHKWVTDEIPLRLTVFYSKDNEDTFEIYGQTYQFDAPNTLSVTAEMDIDEHLIRLCLVDTGYTKRIHGIPGETEEDLTIATLSGIYQMEDIQIIAEAIVSDEFHSNWYISAHYPIHHWTPYLSYGQRRKVASNHTYNMGTRYDINANIGLYFDWLHIDSEKDFATGHFTELQLPPNEIVHNVNVFTVGVSFTF